MTDFALANIDGLPVSVACLGLLYQKSDGMIGQQRGGKASLNLIDLSLLPLTPIMVHICHNSRRLPSSLDKQYRVPFL